MFFTLLGAPSISILSRDPSFQETMKNPRETAGFRKERWLKIMGNQPVEFYDLSAPCRIKPVAEECGKIGGRPFTYAELGPSSQLDNQTLGFLALEEENGKDPNWMMTILG